MKRNFKSGARRLLACMFCSVMAVSLWAVPARREWRTVTQADGTSIEVQVIGDEFYHYTINRDGQRVREINGMYEVVGEAPTPEVAKAHRAKAVARRQRQDIGTTPNPAPKGVVILANFSNQSMQSGHTQATFDELCNSTNCTVNAGYPSAAQYFADQSNGSYRPVFDVFGPVTLSHNVAHYGTDLWVEDEETGEWYQDEGSDSLATDAVVEACRLANQQFTINWADYDSNNDGKIDFVYVIYAGKGQADGGSPETIWPHNWQVSSARHYGNCTYTVSQCKVGGKTIENYAMSGEMSGNSLGGIGTLCHEFGHVMGLPDLYDTKYGTNYKNKLTPGDWNIMDGGSYNGDGHCPPNYDPWEKEFFGWNTSVVLGTDGANISLKANGTDGYKAYQVNSGNKYVGPTTAGVRYYIENRQAVGWDAPLTGHGMLVWTVNFNASKWSNNEPNNTANDPYYTVVSAYGNKIGWDGKTDNCPWNTFPGTENVKSYTPISGHAFTEIAESAGVVTCKYNGGVVKTECTYELVGSNCVVPADGVVAINAALSLTITPNAGYTLDDASCWDVEMGDKNELVYGKDFTYNAATNEFRIEKVTDDVVILAEGKKTFALTWKSNGQEWTTTTSAGTVVLPATDPESCEKGKVFVGWCEQENYSSATTAPTFVKTGDAVTGAKTFYAVFATQGEGGETVEKANAIHIGDKMVLVYETGKKELTSFASGVSTIYGIGTDYTDAPTGAYAFEVVAGSETGTYAFVNGGKYWTWTSGNSLKTTSTLNANSSWNVTFNAGNAVIANAYDATRILQWNNGSPRFACYTSAQKAVQLYKKSTGAAYTDYTTTLNCTPTGMEQTAVEPTAKKAIRDGQMVIIRGKEIYSVTGVRIQ